MLNKYKTNLGISTTKINAVNYYGLRQTNASDIIQETPQQNFAKLFVGKLLFHVVILENTVLLAKPNATIWSSFDKQAQYCANCSALTNSLQTIAFFFQRCMSEALSRDNLHKNGFTSILHSINFVNEDHRSQQCRVDVKLYTCY